MKKTIVITDQTQMPTSNRVCIVGIDKFGRCIRPVYDEFGVPKKLLFIGDNLIIRPKAKVQFDFHDTDITSPHIEDKSFNPDHIIGKGLCTNAEWDNILKDSSYTSVDDIFSNLLIGNRWVAPGADTKSISTLSQVTVNAVNLNQWENKLRYRLSFCDTTDELFDLPISDLAFRELCYKEIRRDGKDRLKVAQRLTKLITTANKVYLRLGLARPWAQPGSSERRCYLQVTGIYSFPDYLRGKSFADFLGQ